MPFIHLQWLKDMGIQQWMLMYFIINRVLLFADNGSCYARGGCPVRARHAGNGRTSSSRNQNTNGQSQKSGQAHTNPSRKQGGLHAFLGHQLISSTTSMKIFNDCINSYRVFIKTLFRFTAGISLSVFQKIWSITVFLT